MVVIMLRMHIQKGKKKRKDMMRLYQGACVANLLLHLPLLFSSPSLSTFSSLPLLVSPLHLSASTTLQFSTASMASAGNVSQPPEPPAAKKVEHVMELFGDVRVDNYYWLRDDSRTNPEVLSYLEQENAYTDSVTSGNCKLRFQ